MNVSMESSIEEEEGAEKVERETLDTTIYQPDFVTEVKIKVFNIYKTFYLPYMIYATHTAVQQNWLGEMQGEEGGGFGKQVKLVSIYAKSDFFL